MPERVLGVSEGAEALYVAQVPYSEAGVTNVTRPRHQVQTCECPPQFWRHCVEVGLVMPLPRSSAVRSYGPCDQAGTRQSIAR
eukprot:134585-Chlamydomonas_euryale.AAC.1